MRNDAILMQLGYSVTSGNLEQVEKVIKNTKNFVKVEKHLISLHDSLKSNLSYVALSSTKDYFKIKNEAKGTEMIKGVNKKIAKWSKKYKIALEKVDGRDTYYVLGFIAPAAKF